MLKRRIRVVVVAGIAMTAAALVTLGTTGAFAASAPASTPAHLTAARVADASGCVTEIFTEADENTYEPCVDYAQVLFNDVWNYQQAHDAYAGANQLLTVDGFYGPDTASDVGSLQAAQSLSLDHELGPVTWDHLCGLDWAFGYTGVYWHDAGCATEPGGGS